MEVETFEVTEMISDGTVDCTEEQKRLIEELCLDGQKKLFVKPDGSVAKNFPYRKMTDEERFIYENLLDKKTKVSEYDGEVMPVRVLQVLSHAKALFDEIWIWHEPDADIDDPVMVGVKFKDGDKWRQERFILARWGTELESMSVLSVKCGQKLLAKLKAQAIKCRRAIDVDSAALESMTPDEIVARKVSDLSGYYCKFV